MPPRRDIRADRTVIGAGGIFVELINEAKARLAPVDAATASQAIRSQRASKLLEGARGNRGATSMD